MRIYFDNNAQELLTEEEAMERAREEVERNELYLNEIHYIDTVTLFEMLSEEGKEKLINIAIETVFDEDYFFRDF